MVDRQRRPVGRELEYLGNQVERPGRERSHMDDAEDPPARDQRRTEQRLDALLAQNRVGDARVVDVVDRDLALRGDATGEPLADGGSAYRPRPPPRALSPRARRARSCSSSSMRKATVSVPRASRMRSRSSRAARRAPGARGPYRKRPASDAAAHPSPRKASIDPFPRRASSRAKLTGSPLFAGVASSVRIVSPAAPAPRRR